MAYLAKYVRRCARFVGLNQRYRYSTSPPIVFSDEVKSARNNGKAIVALESTIITHGMPYPQNLETALQVENIVREQGATPATVALLRGQLTVGLSNEQLQYLAQSKNAVKASRRDLAFISAAKLDGATTVAGTIVAAELAEIPVFVTGGIGGVHRQGEHTLDISADLNELGRSRTLVVCSGVKSILDIGRTLEYLETQGVCVCTFGQSKDFPAFYTRKSGYHAPYHVRSAVEAARILLASHKLQLSSGIVMAVPIPEESAMDETIIEKAISTALKDAENKGIHGKEVTPFILAAVAKATAGASLDANIALVKNNAKVGAAIAVEFQKFKRTSNLRHSSNSGLEIGGGKLSRHFHTSCSTRVSEGKLKNEFPLLEEQNLDGDVLVIGGANVDRTYRLKEHEVKLDGSTHACNTEQCGGGVGRNMAEALWRLRGGRARLLTVIGDDADGQFIKDIAPGLLLDGCIVKNGRTPSYASVMDSKGECLLGLGDMTLHNQITPQLVNRHRDVLEQAPLVILDGNAPQATIDHVLELCNQIQKPVFFEPTDRRKATKTLQMKNNKLSFVSPNINELLAMAHYLSPSIDKELTQNSNIEEIIELCKIVSQYSKCIIVTMGAKGVLIYRDTKEDNLYKGNFYPSQPVGKMENVSGAGDCFASGFIHGLLCEYTETQCVRVGFEAAKKALGCKTTVPSNLSDIEMLK